MESGDIVGRVSKAVGTPGALPDAAGLAWRMTAAAFAATPWDVLLVSAGFGSNASVPNRVALRAVTSWAQAHYSSLLPLQYHDELWWIRARALSTVGGVGLSLQSVRRRIDDTGLEFHIEQARGSGDFEPMATLRLSEVVPAADQDNHDVSFDPVRHTAPDVQVWPDWLRNLRAQAYQRSREGRDAES